MLKSFKSYIRESSDDDGQVLRDLLSSGLISKSEFYDLAKESDILLHSGDFDHRYTVSLNVYAGRQDIEWGHLDNIPFWIEKKINAIPETALLYTHHTHRHQYIGEVVSNLEEPELIKSIQA